MTNLEPTNEMSDPDSYFYPTANAPSQAAPGETIARLRRGWTPFAGEVSDLMSTAADLIERHQETKAEAETNKLDELCRWLANQAFESTCQQIKKGQRRVDRAEMAGKSAAFTEALEKVRELFVYNDKTQAPT